ncbi:hypothetical protein HanRHA438_Chr12g0546711 [Helianthus annuus]|nr:hypothetical protein HanRHA438_Chr12g0546711 [Helianthus annuus]
MHGAKCIIQSAVTSYFYKFFKSTHFSLILQTYLLILSIPHTTTSYIYFL